jgi:hypothetical protein
MQSQAPEIITNKPLEELHFDPENPLFSEELKTSNDKNIIEWMLRNNSLLELMTSIGINGYFPGEPLFVVEENKRLFVVEGNRRLAACKLLNKPSLSSVKKHSLEEVFENIKKENIPDSLPVIIFKSREQIEEYIGYRHVTGAQNWSPLAKARFLSKLYERLSPEYSEPYEVYKILARKIGSRIDYVRSLLTAYKLYIKIKDNEFFNIPELDENTFQFHKLIDAATRAVHISEYLNVDMDAENPLDNLNLKRLEELSRWLFERDNNHLPRVSDTRDITVLNQIVKSPKALEAFKNGKSLKESRQLTDYPNKVLSQCLRSALNEVKNAHSVLPETQEIDKGDLELIVKIADYLKRIKTGILSKSEAPDEFEGL